MKRYRVNLTHTFEMTCVIESQDNDSAKSAIEALTLANFKEVSGRQCVEVMCEGEDVTGDIQPYTPNLKP